MTFIKTHTILFGLLAVVALLSLMPAAEAWVVIGDEWRGVPPADMDGDIYSSHVTEAGTGNIFFGNPYLLEHRNDAPLIFFGSNIFAVLQQIRIAEEYV